MKYIIKDFFSFLLKPKVDTGTQKKSLILKENIYLFLFSLLISLIGAILTTVFLVFNLVETSTERYYQEIPFISTNLVFGINYLLLPIIEELNFRLYLRFTPLNLSVSITIFCYYLISLLLESSYYTIDHIFWIKIAICSLILLFLYFIFRNNLLKGNLENAWKKNIRIVYYISILIFAYFHITKYTITPSSNIQLLQVAYC